MNTKQATATYEKQGLRVHDLKTDPEEFQALWCGRKKFEVRFDDRGYENGDFLRLLETVHTGERMAEGLPLVFTGRELMARVDYVLHGPAYGIEDGWVVLSVTIISSTEPGEAA